ncbi:hypothetical protein OG21DRAFT_1502172 [Imleria badia]|nr:hypothetical protein OG21DRAFT_1502172 [Imleria badia]
MKGNEYLTSIGILHRDISENNIVLGLYPWEERGYLIDFDMAILQDAEESTQVSLAQSTNQLPQPVERYSTKPAQPDGTGHVKGLRTGTFPYISCNVLRGKRHTHFDDVESFLYVLLLFFFSYAGPLPKKDLEDAHEEGFVRPIGSGRLSHMRSWPNKLAKWADGDPQDISQLKYFCILHDEGVTDLVDSVEAKVCLQNNWPEDLQCPIRSLLEDTFTAFRKSTKATPGRRTEVSHAQFIRILDEWLVNHSGLELKFSNCPDFKDSRSIG